jgi:hypothetical protein
MKVIAREDAYGLAYPYAYNESGLMLHVNDAVKNVNGQKEKYYLFPDMQMELVLAAGEKNVKHFRTKRESFVFDGESRLSYGQIGESKEHILFKQQIVHQGFFIWNEYKIYIADARIEKRIAGSRYYADCKAKLLDGSDFVIEIIKSSETSERKKEFLKSNEILTFEIYIDGKGNQIIDRFNVYGNGAIESIESEITDVKRRIYTGTDEVARIRRRVRERVNFNTGRIQEEQAEFRKKISFYEHEFRQEIDAKERELYSIQTANGSTHYQLQCEVKKFIIDIRKRRREIAELEKEFAKWEQERGEIARVEVECTSMENTFIQAAKRCDLAWYRPARIKSFRGENRIHEFLYWCS